MTENRRFTANGDTWFTAREIGLQCKCPGDCKCGWVASDYPNICCCPLTVDEHNVPPGNIDAPEEES